MDSMTELIRRDTEMTAPTGEKNAIPKQSGAREITKVRNDSHAMFFAAVFFGFAINTIVIIRIMQVSIAVIRGEKFA